MRSSPISVAKEKQIITITRFYAVVTKNRYGIVTKYSRECNSASLSQLDMSQSKDTHLRQRGISPNDSELATPLSLCY